MKPTQKRRIGHSPVEVTQLGLGGTALANMYDTVAAEQALATIQAAFDAGVRYFDTAPLYGRGLSETRLGSGLAGLARNDYVLSTKVGYTLEPAALGQFEAGVFVDPLPYQSRNDFSRDAILRSIETSLNRLGCGRIDIVYIHDPDESRSTLPTFSDPYEHSHFSEAMEGAYPTLHELRAQGVIGAIGVGMNQWEMMLDFARAGDFDCFLLAGRYTLLEQRALPGLMAYCAEKGISIVVGGPYNSGILATGAVDGAYYNYAAATDGILERTRKIEAACARHGVPLQAAALQFPLGHPAVATVIPGMRSPAEVAANVSYVEHEIPADLWSELKALALIDPQLAHARLAAELRVGRGRGILLRLVRALRNRRGRTQA